MATSEKNIVVGLRKLAEVVFFAILLVFGNDATATPTQVFWNVDTLWHPQISCSPSIPTCFFQPGVNTRTYSAVAPATYNLTNLPVLNETLIITVDSYPVFDQLWDPNTIQTLHKWLEIRETDCNGALIATRDMPGGVTNLPHVGYSKFYLDPVPVTPGHTYGLCLYYDPMTVTQGYSDNVSFNIANGGTVDIPPVSTQIQVPALPWQAEMLFSACLLVAGQMISKRQNKPKKGNSAQ